MTNINERVASCFSNVFPNLRKEDLPAASTATVAEWDSVAQVTLLTSISEEFSFDFEMEDFEELTSYQKIVDYLQTK
jgi:acyl carrier protein